MNPSSKIRNSRIAVLGFVLSGLSVLTSSAQTDCTVQTEIPTLECEALFEFFGSHFEYGDFREWSEFETKSPTP